MLMLKLLMKETLWEKLNQEIRVSQLVIYYQM